MRGVPWRRCAENTIMAHSISHAPAVLSLNVRRAKAARSVQRAAPVFKAMTTIKIAWLPDNILSNRARNSCEDKRVGVACNITKPS